MPLKISVIVPCYNQGRFLDEALQSVFNQTHTDWECLIINDGSEDETEEVSLRWVERDSRFRYFHQTNSGLGSARNVGLRNAIGDAIQFLDSDDMLLPEKFERQLTEVKELNANWIVFCDYYRASTFESLGTSRWQNCPTPFDLKRFQEEVIQKWEFTDSIPIHCFIFSARTASAIRIEFDESLPNHEDWDFLVRSLDQKKTVHYVDEPLVLYRSNPISMTRDAGLMGQGFLEAISALKNVVDSNVKRTLLQEKEEQVRKRYRKHLLRRTFSGRLLLFVERSLLHLERFSFRFRS